ncbi:MAG: hypothetical protein WBG10_16265 [Pseudolabrys sp.]
MRKVLSILAMLATVATPAFAQSFDSDNGTGNVLSFGTKPTAPPNDKIAGRQSGMRDYGMVPRTGPAHMTRHMEGAAYNGNWGFALGSCVVPEVNDPVGVWLPPQCER